MKKACERDADDDLGRSRDREPSLVRDTGEPELKPQCSDRENGIWKRRTGVEAREGHLSMRKGESRGDENS